MAAAPSTTLRIVPVAEADLELVAALVNRAFGIYSDLFKGQRTSPTDYRDEVGEAARVILVEDSGKLVATGMIALAERFAEPDQLGPAGTVRPTSAPDLADDHPWSGALYFGLAGVEPALMNGGHGKRMVAHVEQLARDEGFSRVALGTVREFGLVDYYEKLDYRVFHEAEHPVGHWDFVVPHHYCEMVKAL
jgi:GNAT superfamily N-acetyltransferase